MPKDVADQVPKCDGAEIAKWNGKLVLEKGQFLVNLIQIVLIVPGTASGEAQERKNQYVKGFSSKSHKSLVQYRERRMVADVLRDNAFHGRNRLEVVIFMRDRDQLIDAVLNLEIVILPNLSDTYFRME